MEVSVQRACSWTRRDAFVDSILILLDTACAVTGLVFDTKSAFINLRIVHLSNLFSEGARYHQEVEVSTAIVRNMEKSIS